MPEYLKQQDAFLKCKREGCFMIREEIDIERIHAMVKIAKADLETVNSTKKNLSKESAQWNSVYKLSYDALHELTEAYLWFEKVKIDSHQCLFAYLCEKHPQLDFNWDFFERVRTKRNGVHYYGTLIRFEDWKEAELQFQLYSKKLEEEIKKKSD